MIAVIAGASGLTGSWLLRLLLQDPGFSQVIALTRRPLELTHPKLLELRVSDFTGLSSLPALPEGALFFSALGTTIKTAGSRDAFRQVDFDAILEFGKLAKKNGARGFLLVSATGANPGSRIFYNRVKGETEDALRGLNLASLMIFRPGLLLGERRESRTAERLGILAAQCMPKAWTRGFATPVDLLARSMLLEAKTPSPGVKILEARELI